MTRCQDCRNKAKVKIFHSNSTFAVAIAILPKPKVFKTNFDISAVAAAISLNIITK